MAKHNHKSVLEGINKVEHCLIRLAFLLITLFAIWKYLAKEWQDTVAGSQGKRWETNQTVEVKSNATAVVIPPPLVVPH